MTEGNSFKGMIELDPDDRIVDINPAAMTILGLSREKIKDCALLEVIGDDPQLVPAFQRCLADSEGGRQEIIVTKQNSSYIFELNIINIQDSNTNQARRVLQLTDISYQKQQDSFTSILDTFKDYFFETDVAGVVTNINKSFCEHLGYSRKEDVVGKHFRHFTNRESVREVYHNFTKVFEEKKAVTLFNYSYKTANGRLHVGETTLSPIFEGENVVGAWGVLRDITDRLKAEEELLKTKQELENRAEELTMINRIAVICGQSLNLDLILQKVCIELAQIFPVSNVGIRIISELKNSFKLKAFHSTEFEPRDLVGLVLPIEDDAAFKEACETNRTVVIRNSPLYASANEVQDGAATLSRYDSIAVPLLVRGKMLGFIDMFSREPGYVFNEKEIKLAEIIALQVAAAINNTQIYAQTRSALDVTEHDLEIGRKIQSGFFPEKIPSIPGWEIAAYFSPARQVAGDFYDFFQIEDSNLTVIVIGDVCDKGVGAALFMVLCRSLLRAFSYGEINPRDLSESIKRIITKTNQYIEKNHSGSSFTTLFFGILEPESGILYYVNGGHEPLAMLNREGKIIRRIRPTGPAVGLLADANFKVEQIDFSRGDFLVGFTDGIQDTLNFEGDYFSEERLLKFVQNPWTSLFSMVYELRIELENFMGGQKQYDDITIISVRRKVTQDAEQHAICRTTGQNVLREILQFIESAAVECELSPNEASGFIQAAEIACDNILQSGFNGKESGLMSLSFEKSVDDVKLIIRDNGNFISSFQLPDPNREISNGKPDGKQPELRKLNTLMDQVSYKKKGGVGNELILCRKHLQYVEN